MKSNENLIKEIEEFDNAFADGIFAVPRNPNEPRVKIRALMDYCRERGNYLLKRWNSSLNTK